MARPDVEAMTPSDRALLVYAAQGELTRACQLYAEQRAYRGDHVFRDELMRLCFAWGEALNVECGPAKRVTGEPR